MNKSRDPLTLLIECLEDLPDDFKHFPMFVNLLGPGPEDGKCNRNTPLPLIAVDVNNTYEEVYLYVNGLLDLPLDPSAALTFNNVLETLSQIHKEYPNYLPVLSKLSYKGETIAIGCDIHITSMQLKVPNDSYHVVLEVHD